MADPGQALVTYVGEELVLDASGSVGAASYHWSFGDGETLSSEGPDVAHAWASPGHYGVVLEVQGEDGRTVSAPLRVDVVWPLSAEKPQRSGRVAASSGGALLFAALPDFDAVAVVDPAARVVVGHLDVCSEPVALSHAPEDDLLAVACADSGQVELWNSASLELAQTVTLDHGHVPRAVLLRDATELWVLTGGDGSLRSVDLVSGSLNWQVDGLDDPVGLAAMDGRVFVTRSRSPEDGGRWWLGEVETPGGGAPELEAQLLRLDQGVDSDTSSRGVPNFLHSPSLSPDGRQVVFPSLQSNNQAGVFRDGVPLTHETTARAVLSRVALADGQQLIEGTRKIFDDRDFAVDATFSPLGDWVYVAMLGTGSVDVLDGYSFENVGSYQGIGQGVVALWLDGSGRELWALSGLTREFVLTGVRQGGDSGEELTRLDLRPGGLEVLADEVLLGKQIFHAAGDSRMSRDGYLSCASCHLDGTHDGRTWDFTDRGEGLRNTVDLRGRAGTGHGPIHWSANFDEVQDFEGDIRNAMGGSGFLSDQDWQASSDPLGLSKAGLSEELDALSAYLEGLVAFPASPHRNSDGSLTEAAVAGQDLFESEALGCVLCHPAPSYTDSGWQQDGMPLVHDVGTITAASGGRMGAQLTGIDTPSLRGVWDSSPYFHDGSAASLRAVIEEHGHPTPSEGGLNLSSTELDQLEAFLLQLE